MATAGCHANSGAFWLASGKGLTWLALNRSCDFWDKHHTTEIFSHSERDSQMQRGEGAQTHVWICRCLWENLSVREKSSVKTFVNHWKTFVNHWKTFVKHGKTFVNYWKTFVNRKNTFVNCGNICKNYVKKRYVCLKMMEQEKGMRVCVGLFTNADSQFKCRLDELQMIF